MQKMYIGYDLGDGETIINYMICDLDLMELSTTGKPCDLLMPRAEIKGRPIPTFFARDAQNGKILYANEVIYMDPESFVDVTTNFKFRPMALIGPITKERYEAVKEAFRSSEKGWPDIPEAQCKELLFLRDHIVEFTNALFQEIFENNSNLDLLAIDAVEFCIGHPTKWSDLDVMIYRNILRLTILGSPQFAIGERLLPAEMTLAAESRAAFLYVRNEYSDKGWATDNFRVLIDVGSSTVDVTALSGRSINGVLNDGHNYLGARIIDYLVLEWYVSELENMNETLQYQDAVKHNPSFDKLMLYFCRKAKETMFSALSQQLPITVAGLKPVYLSRSAFMNLLDKPIRPIMEKYLHVPTIVLNEVGDHNWKQEFQSYISKQMKKLEDGKYKVSQVVLTGSAARMPFVFDICREIFNQSDIPMSSKSLQGGINVNHDINPEKAISYGLALVGQSNERSKMFRADMQDFIRSGLGKTIEDNLPDLAENLSGTITEFIAEDIMKKELVAWKNGTTDTLNDAMSNIRAKCSEKQMMERLKSNSRYNAVLETWTRDKLLRSVDQQLEALCKKYKVTFTSGKISILATSNVDGVGDGLSRDIAEKILSPAEMLSGIIALIAGIITFFILPTVLAVILVIISSISVTIASIIITILAAIPGAGLVLLAAIAGVAIAKLVKNELDDLKDLLTEKITAYNLPQWVRDMVKIEKLYSSIDTEKANIKQEIKKGITSDESAKRIVKQITDKLSGTIEEKAKEISYIIENA